MTFEYWWHLVQNKPENNTYFFGLKFFGENVEKCCFLVKTYTTQNMTLQLTFYGATDSQILALLLLFNLGHHQTFSPTQFQVLLQLDL